MTEPTFTVKFEQMTSTEQLRAVFLLTLDTQEKIMALQDQIDRLTSVVNGVRDKQAAQSQQLADLQTSVDNEQAQVQEALGLLTQDNPDLEAAISTLQGVDTNVGTISETIGTIKTDVESTIPDQPPTPYREAVARSGRYKN